MTTSTEPMYLISESELNPIYRLYFNSDLIRTTFDAVRARGVAQQAPDYGLCEDFCIHYKSISTEMGEGHFCRKNDRLVENVTSCPALFQKLKDHDAALIAQEREKWEREHIPTFHAENPDAFSPWYNVEMVAARVESAKAQARGDVLKDAAIAILKEAGIPETSVSHYTPKQDSDIPSIRVDKVVHILESLRSEVGKMNEQKPREKHLLYLDKSTPEEFINAELMDWIYLVGDISTPYELDFVRQFGHAFKTRDNQMREEGAKAERERVLKIVDQIREAALGMLNPPTGSFSSQDRFRKECMDEIDLLIKSLRSPGQKRERDPE